MPHVGVPTLLALSAKYLLRPPQVRGWHLALLAFCTAEENGGVIAGAASWTPDQWLFVLGQGGTRSAVDDVVSSELSEWIGDDLIVTGYSTDLEHAYQQSRIAGKKSADLRRARRLAQEGEPDPTSPDPTVPNLTLPNLRVAKEVAKGVGKGVAKGDHAHTRGAPAAAEGARLAADFNGGDTGHKKDAV